MSEADETTAPGDAAQVDAKFQAEVAKIDRARKASGTLRRFLSGDHTLDLRWAVEARDRERHTEGPDGVQDGGQLWLAAARELDTAARELVPLVQEHRQDRSPLMAVSYAMRKAEVRPADTLPKLLDDFDELVEGLSFLSAGASDVVKKAAVPDEFRKTVSQIAKALKETRSRVKGLTTVKRRADFLKYVDHDASGTSRYDIREAKRLMGMLDNQRTETRSK